MENARLFRGLGHSRIRNIACLICLMTAVLPACAQALTSTIPTTSETSAAMPIWVWPISLFLFCFLIGIVAVLGGVGGGVLYVPLVSGFFPFHLDFVRGAGLFVALCSSLAAGPNLLRRGLASMRLALPVALLASTGAVCGALVGLALPTQLVQFLLGAAILGIATMMAFSKQPDDETPGFAQDRLGAWLGIQGIYHEETTGRDIPWHTRRTPLGLALFVFIGFVGGMFGLGAGWANVPVLNLVLGVPLKVAVSSGHFMLSIVGTSAAWIYMNKGCVLPIIVVPSVLGMMLGSKVGARLLPRVKPSLVRKIVIGVLLFAGAKSMLKGLGIG